ncbi:ETS domain-containing transcription factor ERF-like isoform X1 [Lates japonicus]|uniref:ETS domain-containing transcription factor ERF-like isoform X1 n=1 Tax=Lates japonicus TaxID=270547 RepID=A0AAD3MTU0_LATJO|nr:ETS domain-containing transcription factor ERF-like isoform X1 [Lates japonicus]
MKHYLQAHTQSVYNYHLSPRAFLHYPNIVIPQPHRPTLEKPAAHHLHGPPLPLSHSLGQHPGAGEEGQQHPSPFKFKLQPPPLGRKQRESGSSLAASTSSSSSSQSSSFPGSGQISNSVLAAGPPKIKVEPISDIESEEEVEVTDISEGEPTATTRMTATCSPLTAVIISTSSTTTTRPTGTAAAPLPSLRTVTTTTIPGRR